MKNRKLQAAVLSWLTAGMFIVQPPLTLAAAIEADQRAGMANQPIVTETASHVPLVNITTPTAGGVSRNLYTMFNVPQSGAILNNATAMTNTKLAGWINKNPFLLGGAAKIIVNEITNANPTHINGFLEVAGNKASVVIANPNGIMVNGGGFINTANALLTTGRPEYDHIGNLQDIRVEKGTVSVDGAGLNGREADSVSIYTRAAEINAWLWANYLNITTGANIINTKTGTINLTEAKENITIKADTVQNENEAFSMKRVSTALVRNPRRIRIDEAGHSERGKVFNASEFRDLDSGYGAYHNGNAGKINVWEWLNE